MLATMSEQGDTGVLNWSELGVSGLLPTGTVTLLLADVEGSTRLWETQPGEMTTAVARLNRTVSEIIAAHDGVRPVEQGEGDSFVAAFARASDALAAALDLQRAPLAPIRLRVGVHTGEIQLRDEGNYAGPTINRTARLRDLAHGGQTVLSGATEPLVIDWLPADVWLTDLGTHPLRDLPRPERVVQLCHPDLANDFPPLCISKVVAASSLPAQLTNFVGREAQIKDVRQILSDNRLVTLTGAGGVGKTRLAVQVAAELYGEFADGVWWVDLAPINDPELVALTVARTLGLSDQPGLSTVDRLLRFVRDRQMLVVLDNCEHLLDASAELVVALLRGAAKLRLLTTSREAIGVAGEVSWRAPSLTLADEAIALFADRARNARADFTLADDNAATVGEICARLDGVPLAIELAAARVRALSVNEILDSLHDRFRLLTGGARTAVRRQQTLRASVDWSHALLTEPERVLFRRLAAFLGGFDHDAGQTVAGGGELQRFQVLDQLTLLVDKSLVTADNSGGTTRYRLLETVRQYALEKLGESGEADPVRSRHRDYYTAMAAVLDTPAGNDYEQRLERADIEIDNLRAAFAWSLENADAESALALASSLQPLWLARGRLREGLAWFDAVHTDGNAPQDAVRARALADRAVLATATGAAQSLDRARQALAIARDVDDSAVLVRSLAACGYIAAFSGEAPQPYLDEAIGLARRLDDRWRLSQILSLQAGAAVMGGEPTVARAAGAEGRVLAEALGDRFISRRCRWCLGCAQMMQGDLAGAVAHFGALAHDSDAARDDFYAASSLALKGMALAWQGEAGAARAAADAAIAAAAEQGALALGMGYWALTAAGLAAGDASASARASEAVAQHWRASALAPGAGRAFGAQSALMTGDLTSARRWADEAVTAAGGWLSSIALTARARVAIAEDEPDRAERSAHDALQRAVDSQAYLGISDTLECLAALAGQYDSHREAARLFAAAESIRQRMGAVRFKIYDAGYQASEAALRDALGERDFDSAWGDGAALSVEEAIAYVRRGRGERKRPASGWASHTPTERDVVRLVSDGLGNKDIATRLFVSPRTVQTHLTHVYTKLGLTSRVQLAQEVARHA